MSLTGRDPLRLRLPTRAEVRAVACPRCGSRAGTPCNLSYPEFRFLPTHHKGRVEAARRTRMSDDASHRPHKCNDCGATIASGARCSECQAKRDAENQ